MKTEASSRLRDKVDCAFEYRGNVSIDLVDGHSVEGYLFNRGHRAKGEHHSGFIDLFRKSDQERVRIGIERIVDVRLTGRDHYKPFVPDQG